MPCIQCDDGMWRWGENGDCEYETREECERANEGNVEGRGSRVLDAIAGDQWLIQPEALHQIIAIAQRVHDQPQALQTRMGRPLQDTQETQIRDGTAIIPMIGPVFRYANLFTQISGATSLELLARDFQKAQDDPNVERILLNIDSPGGMASGIAEFADHVRASDKPVTAYVSDRGLSAGYWIAAAAPNLYVAKTGSLGSIGVVLTVDLTSDRNKLEIVSSQSPNKRPDVSTDEGRRELQSRVDRLAQIFVDSVAEFRGVSTDTVLSRFGQGGVRVGEEAVEAGMADGVSSFESIMSAVSSGTTKPRGRTTMSNKAQGEEQTMTAQEIADAWPDAAEALRAEGEHRVANSNEEAIEQARIEGAKAERERIQAVEDALIPGHEQLIADLKFDGVTTGDQAAAKVLKAEKEAREMKLDGHKYDGNFQVPTSQGAGGDSPDMSLEGLSPDERAEEEWNRDENIRTEFRTLNRYKAYRRRELQSA